MEIILLLAEVTGTTYCSAKENGKGKLDRVAIYSKLKDKNTK